MTSAEALTYLSTLQPFGYKPGLESTRRLAARVGNPHEALQFIHVAGTNGKGSTCAMLDAIYRASGRRVGLYTSPHLVRFNERIRVAGELLADDALAAILEEVERVNAGRPITFFEVTTVAAFLAFARTPADLVLLEVGMGGRLDATNVVARPLVSVVTPVSFDHMEYLGDTLALIAAEKAGILRA
ncbi:MAG: bifunctional folylpolyglutamate synthase/dihydrofolate synthase, partial [Verrucomicrobiota bacterium]